MKTYIFYQSLSIKLIAFMIMVISLVSCAKQEIISDLDFQKSLLAGSGSYQNTKRTWKIDSLTQNGVVLNLSIAQKRYTKTFFTDGTYADSDGNLGAWSMPSTKDLTIISNNGISKIHSLLEEQNIRVIEKNNLLISSTFLNLISSFVVPAISLNSKNFLCK
jgi:hypothetical protein